MNMLNVKDIKGREPLEDYPWRSEVDRLLDWLQGKESHVQCFCFDLMMSASYIDAASGIENSIEHCNSVDGYNAHVGFINLCSPCYTQQGIWRYQKAIKPQSGALGKLSSELILRFVEKLYPELTRVLAIGGTELADALLEHINGMLILAEVKSAPLLTYPFLFRVPESTLGKKHEKITITQSQFRQSQSAIFLHKCGLIKLGEVGKHLWPFRPLVDFMIDKENQPFIQRCAHEWLQAKIAYEHKDKSNGIYFLTNASGMPPKLARIKDNWPQRESISDSKTSAGLDRTDDIKKAIYQTLKIGSNVKDWVGVKTAIISNLPAYRHGKEYVDIFDKMVWGFDYDMIECNAKQVIEKGKLRRVFDFIITLDISNLRSETW